MRQILVSLFALRLIAPITLASFTLVLMCDGAAHAQSIPASTMPKLKTANELRVMTFNLRVRTIIDGHNIWDNRRDLVVERIRAFDPDLLGTQEGLDSMATDLRQHLGDYTFRGVGRNDGKQRGEMCGVFFKTARFELLDGGNFWLSKTPEKPGSRAWAQAWPRMVTWVKLRPHDGGATFYWFNTHFDAYSPWARAASSKLLRDRIAHIAGTLPCIVTGDFNAGPGSTPYRNLLAPHSNAEASLHDVFRVAHPVATRDEGSVHFFTGRTRGQRIDWILASSHFQALDAEIDRTRGPHGYPSDHFPVTATLRNPAATPFRGPGIPSALIRPPSIGRSIFNCCNNVD